MRQKIELICNSKKRIQEIYDIIGIEQQIESFDNSVNVACNTLGVSTSASTHSKLILLESLLDVECKQPICSICITPINKFGFTSSCGHSFHNKCIQKYKNFERQRFINQNTSVQSLMERLPNYKNYSCPNCRQNLYEKNSAIFRQVKIVIDADTNQFLSMEDYSEQDYTSDETETEYDDEDEEEEEEEEEEDEEDEEGEDDEARDAAALLFATSVVQSTQTSEDEINMI